MNCAPEDISPFTGTMGIGLNPIEIGGILQVG
jgi:hypothetical protein